MAAAAAAAAKLAKLEAYATTVRVPLSAAAAAKLDRLCGQSRQAGSRPYWTRSTMKVVLSATPNKERKGPL